MKRVVQILKNELDLVFLIILTSLLRFVNLGYSDYVGDEVKALLRLQAGQTFVNFFLSQRKGPLQFMVTYLDHYINPGYEDEFLTRLPFAIASLLAVIFFYLFIRNLFGRRVAFLSSFFFATTGIIVGISRVAQYQSLVMVLCLFSLYIMELSTRYKSLRYSAIYLAILSWTGALFSHYDAIFLLPILLYFIFRWLLFEPQYLKKKLAHLFGISAFCLILLLIFYIPFVRAVDDDTLRYWSERITPVKDGIPGTIFLFKLYQPLLALPLYFICGGIGIFAFVSPYLPKWRWINRFILEKTIPEHPYVFYLLCWFGIPVLFYEGYVQNPGTHIYTYFVPGFVLVGAGVDYLLRLWESFWNKYGKLVSRGVAMGGLALVMLFLYYQDWMVYIDHTTQYPWEAKQFLFWTFEPPATSQYVFLYGFPYYRAWAEIGDYTEEFPDIGYYYTNEKSPGAQFYVPDLIYNETLSGFYILVENPLSFIQYTNGDKAFHWVEHHDPDKIIYDEDGNRCARIYIMPVGTLAELRERGQ